MFFPTLPRCGVADQGRESTGSCHQASSLQAWVLDVAKVSIRCLENIDLMFAHAVLAVLVLPGVVAGVVPALIAASVIARPGLAVPAFLLFVTGLGVLLSCVREFYVAGKGTLAPWSPPQNLVVTGLYRFSRNPMYIGVLLILLGWATLFPSRAMALYVIGVAAVFQLRVVLAEEPWQSRTFGDAWLRYSAEVPRWIWPPHRGNGGKEDMEIV